MELPPLVSVILPAYDYADYLPQAIDSALAQDWPALEVIVVDDGSTDATPDVIASYGDRIRSVRRPNGGLNAATDTGIAAARGELLTFLDADDTWRPGRVRLLAEALASHPDAGLAWGDMEVVDGAGNLTQPSFRRASGIEPLSGRVLGRLLWGNFISAGSLMVRASLRDRFHPIPAFAAWQDWWIASQVAAVADVQAIPEAVNIYRQHDRNMNLGADAARLTGLYRTEIPFRRWLLQNVPAPAASIDQWVMAVRLLDTAIHQVAAQDGRTPAEVAPLEERSHRVMLEEGRHALTAGDPVAAVARLAAAIGAWPGSDDARALLAQALPLAARQADRTAAAEPVARSIVTFVLVEELDAEPELLAGYARTVSGADDATLVVGGVDDRAAAKRLMALVRAAGMESEDAADVLAIQARDAAAAAAEVGQPIARRLETALACGR